MKSINFPPRQSHREGAPTPSPFHEPGYERLALVLEEAFAQAAYGKGAERHAGDQPFHEQPMQAICDLLGNADGLAYQAIKKVRESRGLPTVDAQVRELLGAIVYIAGMVIYLQEPPAPTDEGSVLVETLEKVYGGNGWIEWKGGECPVNLDSVVEVCMIGVERALAKTAGKLNWNHKGCDGDIHAYRVIGMVSR